MAFPAHCIPRLVLPLLLCLTGIGCKPPEQEARQGSGGIDLPPLPLRQTEDATAIGQVVALFADSRDPFQQAQAEMLQLSAARSTGATLEFRDALGDPETQRRQLSELLNSPPAALFLQPLDPAGLDAVLNQLKQAGTFVIGLDERLIGNDSSSDTVVHLDAHHLGLQAAEIALAAIQRRNTQESASGEEASVLQLRGSDASAVCTSIHRGFETRLREAPSVTLVHDAPTGWSPIQAQQRTLEGLRIQNRFDIVFAHSDETGAAADAALRQAALRDRCLIIGANGFGGPRGGIELIRRNVLDATLLRPLLVDFGWEILRRRATDPGFSPKPAYVLRATPILPSDLTEVADKVPEWPEW